MVFFHHQRIVTYNVLPNMHRLKKQRIGLLPGLFGHQNENFATKQPFDYGVPGP